MIELENLKIRLEIVVPKTWSNTKKGQFFEDLIAEMLQQQGWHIKKRMRCTGMEIDLLAYSPNNEEEILIECKFYKDKLIDTRVIKEMCGKAVLQGLSKAVLVSTTELNSEVKGLLHEQKHKEKIEFSCWLSDKIAQDLIKTRKLEPPNLNQELRNSIKVITLLITPNQTVWVAEVLYNGEPIHAIIFPTSQESSINENELNQYFKDYKLWEGLKILNSSNLLDKSQKNNLTKESNSKIERDTVAEVSVAESFEMYQRPCNPRDFVGRIDIQNQFWDFLSGVRNQNHKSRIICFLGDTGIGKSSLIVKLKHDCFHKKKYQDKFYIYCVDVRSAKEKTFISSAAIQAMQQAIDDKFIDLENHKIFVESVENPLLSTNSSIEIILNKLKQENKLIVIFFDQFEELFTKESLFFVYEKFERLAYEINSIQENIVIGFCWRTGILMPNQHPAYYLWFKLEDKRIDIKIKPFSEKETSQFIQLFEEYLAIKNKQNIVNKRTIKFLKEHCEGFPWILKKICSVIVSELELGNEKLERYNMNNLLQEIFKNELDSLSPEQYECLKYVAHNSPIDFSKLFELYGNDTIKRLEEKKFLIKSGINYIIYWDIFREFIKNGELPSITVKYRPRVSLDQIWEILKVFRDIPSTSNDYREIEITELLDKVQPKRTEKTLRNSLWDLIKFFELIKDKKANKIMIPEFILSLKEEKLADYLAEQLKEHIVVKELHKQYKKGNKVTLWGIQGIIKHTILSDENENENEKQEKTYQDYTSRIISWLLYCGILEKTSQQNYFCIPKNIGNEKGKPEKCKLSILKKDKTKTNKQMNLFENM